MKLLRRLFGAAEAGKIDPSLHELRELIMNTETRPAVLQSLCKLNKRKPLEGGFRGLLELMEEQEGMEKGLNALTDLALGKGALGESILGRLASDKDLAPELRSRDANQDERVVLNLWGVTLCVMCGLPKVSNEEKHAFLDQYHEFIYFVCCAEDEAARLAWAVDFRRISALCEARYQEYFDAFGEMMRRQEAVHRDPSVHLLPAVPLMNAITKNLFGLESDNYHLLFVVHTLVMSKLITFAEAFGAAEAWPTMRHFLEEACRVLRSGATNS